MNQTHTSELNPISRPRGMPWSIQPVLAFERWLVRRLLQGLNNPPLSIALWNGEEIATSAQTPIARIQLCNRRALYRLIHNPDLEFGELFTSGDVKVDGDLVSLLGTVFKAQESARSTRLRLAIPHSNTLARARSNVHRHYDLGNDFYRLWLDDRMVYTCAYFKTPEATLEAAQKAKMDHICRKLMLKPGETIVEAGCGWGALALHMARHHGVRVKAFNVSSQQILLARERARAESLHDRVEFIQDDYRNISGTFDAFVSVGMLEHVGPDHYRDLGAVIHRSLTDQGRGLIHSIGRNRPEKPNAWLTARIFPGAYMPSLKEIMNVLEPHPLSVLDVENLRPHYAATLKHWLDRFDAHHAEVRNMFDEQFVRMWRLYLSGSIAGFATGGLQLFQILFARPAQDSFPLTRRHLYLEV